HSPAAAAWLDRHAWLKPAVRMLLLPAAGLAFLFMEHPAAAGAACALFFCLAGLHLRYRRSMRKGGAN
ncbi:MAG TPA: hypothetical protein VK654_15735, partial [Nitrospirota bacterium]|nr:hypothetical protein [Nitrospirota bacterium]